MNDEDRIDAYEIAVEPDEVISSLYHRGRMYATKEEAQRVLDEYEPIMRSAFQVYHVVIEPVEDET